MEIILDLSKHCIETEIRRVYHQALSRLLKNRQDTTGAEDILTLTMEALETFNFGMLRSQYPALCGHTIAQVVLTRIKEKPHLYLDDQRIEPPIRTRKAPETRIR